MVNVHSVWMCGDDELKVCLEDFPLAFHFSSDVLSSEREHSGSIRFRTDCSGCVFRLITADSSVFYKCVSSGDDIRAFFDCLDKTNTTTGIVPVYDNPPDTLQFMVSACSIMFDIKVKMSCI